MGIESSVGLVVAALDLKLVRLVRAAMQNGVGGGSAGGAGLVRPQPVVEPRRRIEPEPQFEPRPRVRPEPMFEPRAKLFGAVPSLGCRDACVPTTPTEPVEKATHSPSPIEPPWKVRPWEEMRDAAVAPPVRKIKVIQVRPDIQCKGSVIDLFI